MRFASIIALTSAAAMAVQAAPIPAHARLERRCPPCLALLIPIAEVAATVLPEALMGLFGVGGEAAAAGGAEVAAEAGGEVLAGAAEGSEGLLANVGSKLGEFASEGKTLLTDVVTKGETTFNPILDISNAPEELVETGATDGETGGKTALDSVKDAAGKVKDMAVKGKDLAVKAKNSPGGKLLSNANDLSNMLPSSSSEGPKKTTQKVAAAKEVATAKEPVEAHKAAEAQKGAETAPAAR